MPRTDSRYRGCDERHLAARGQRLGPRGRGGAGLRTGRGAAGSGPCWPGAGVRGRGGRSGPGNDVAASWAAVRVRGRVFGGGADAARAAAYSRSAAVRAAAAWAARCWASRRSATASASAASRVDQDDRGQGAVAGQVGERADQPGGLAQPVPGRAGGRDAPVRRAGGAVVGVGGLAQDAAAERGGGHVQRVRGGPRGVGGSGRVASRERADLRGGLGRDPGGVLPPGVPLRRRQAGIGRRGPARPTAGTAWARSGRRRACRPRTTPGSPSLPGVTGQGDGVPGDLARVRGAVPLPDQHPGLAPAGRRTPPRCQTLRRRWPRAGAA